eukprot:TRINITY_DN1264_c1_g2_i1.p1 TRINITY_DN1264_c1_g2~~TRINITY_DN1264_c1_g2_i1.p1  ORF type:complete len:765 (+),score=99.06 TRINITY_DN1264_c1_g2_i1:65-2359(+)
MDIGYSSFTRIPSGGDAGPPYQQMSSGVMRSVGAHIMMPQAPPSAGGSQPASARLPPLSDRMNWDTRFDCLEQELMRLKSARGPGASDYNYGPLAYNAVGPPAYESMSMVGASNYASASRPMTQAGLMQVQPTNVDPVYHELANVRREHSELMNAHKELVQVMQKQSENHTELMKAHMDLMKAHKSAQLNTNSSGGRGSKLPVKKKHPSLGVIRLDYNYPPAAGDTDSPASFGYDVFYRVVPGLTFERAQAGKFSEEVERNFAEGIKFLEQRGVNAITGDCGFMMAFQVLARKIASKPVFMSSMVQCPVIAAAFDPRDHILILTANGQSLKPQKEVLLSSCGFNVDSDRFKIVGCQDVLGFDAVAKGEKVPVELVQPGIVKKTMAALQKWPEIKGILLECTELPPYADALRATTGLPVWDCITGADFYINAFKDNPRFGVDDWQAEWDGEQDEYTFGVNLGERDKMELVNKITNVAPGPKKTPRRRDIEKTKKKLLKKQSPILGVIRLDYSYPPAAGDIDCPGSYAYDVLFRMVPGLTFEMAQAGRMTFEVEKEFKMAIKWLESKGVSGITGDCGFMMAFQPIAREIATVPVFMSSMVQSPMISVAFDKYDKILILTANSMTLRPQKECLLSQCGFDVDDSRFVIYGCQDVPGFDAVAKGEKVDVDKVTPGIIDMVLRIIRHAPTIRAILLECTELPPYADALRHRTGLPVFDAITCADFFISARTDNPRFGLNEWQLPWDGTVDVYKLGENLTAEQRERAQYA